MSRLYIEHAQRLVAAAQENSQPMTHGQALAAVAAYHNAASWTALLAREAQGWRARLKARFARKPKPGAPYILDLEPLMYTELHEHALSMGRKTDGKLCRVLDSRLTRHVLVTGAYGTGISAFQAYLLLQQIVRGGGFLYLDWISLHLPAVQRVSQVVGKPMVSMAAEDVACTPLLLARAGVMQASLHLSVPEEDAELRAADLAYALWPQLHELMAIRQKHGGDGPPFLVLLPLEYFPDVSQLPALLAQARAANVAFVMTVRTPEQRGLLEEYRELLTANATTRIHFRAERQEGPPALQTRRQQFVESIQLGAREALVCTEQGSETVRIPQLRLS